MAGFAEYNWRRFRIVEFYEPFKLSSRGKAKTCQKVIGPMFQETKLVQCCFCTLSFLFSKTSKIWWSMSCFHSGGLGWTGWDLRFRHAGKHFCRHYCQLVLIFVPVAFVTYSKCWLLIVLGHAWFVLVWAVAFGKSSTTHSSRSYVTQFREGCLLMPT